MTASILAETKLGTSFISIPDRAPNTSRAARCVEVLAVIMWNLGPDFAFDHYRVFCRTESLDVEMGIAWRVEAMAFPGTNWERLFNLMCGEA